ncbi:MAG: hypothetical protein BCS36_02880 [Desulfovibrio sp. MES5]|uniref:hypothetical protein n=1 Tax=Desulfovibrio sp. MES5 TaxID=1899016 RepID=UPI000B9D24E0|nr:hypothetical protein [Desulfovibrio sp. MES5]OXS28174.1 MAG: hypothetical protein BCS36_02880 [Desulfovibrio sp. MES5]
MAFAYVNPLSALWQRRGLSNLLMPEGFDAFAPQPETTARPPLRRPAGGTAGSAANGHGGRQAGTPTFSGQAGASGQPGASAPAAGPAAGQSGPLGQGSRPARRPAAPAGQSGQDGHGAPRAAAQTAPPQPESGVQANAASGHPWKPLPPHVWPAPWRQQLEKTRPGLVLWTYWNLGLDLCDPQAEGRLERRAFLQKLLQDLAHPAGTHTFWPAGMPAAPEDHTPGMDEGLVPHADAFWSGTSRLGARGVVVMGSAAVKALGLPPGLRPLQQTRYRGHMVWVLWDVDYMQREDQRYASMLAFLRQSLRQVAR